MLTGINALDDVIISISIETGSIIHVKIDGGSMLPLVRKNDVLGIRAGQRDIKRGDIILFRSSGRMVVHRVIGANNDTITTKGDASTTFDKPVHPDDIIGRAVFIESRGRRTDIDTRIWRFLNRVLALYSWWCGIILERLLDSRAANSARHPALRISGAMNMLLPAIVFLITRRL